MVTFPIPHSLLSFPRVHPRCGEIFGETKPRDRDLAGDKDLSYFTLRSLKDPEDKFRLDQESFLGGEDTERVGRVYNSGVLTNSLCISSDPEGHPEGTACLSLFIGITETLKLCF